MSTISGVMSAGRSEVSGTNQQPAQQTGGWMAKQTFGARGRSGRQVANLRACAGPSVSSAKLEARLVGNNKLGVPIIKCPLAGALIGSPIGRTGELPVHLADGRSRQNRCKLATVLLAGDQTGGLARLRTD